MRLLRDPLVQFGLLGAALLLAYALTADLYSPDSSRRIEISAAEIEFLAAQWERQWQRPPTGQELEALVEARVREEVLYREALAVGLDRNDAVVRRAMVRKMELLSQDLALLADPTDRELRAFFEERQEEYRIPPRISFSHVYFNPDRRGSSIEDAARRVLADVRAEVPPPVRAPERGDRFMLAYDYALLSPQEVQRQFGSDFAGALFELAPGWQGPVPSGYGIHLVYIGDRVESRLPKFAEVRQEVVADFNRMRADRARDALYEGLRERYEVVIDAEAPKTLF